MSNFKKAFEYFYWGADLHLLNQCIEEKARFIRNELCITLISILFCFILFPNIHIAGLLVGIGIFLLYKMYLSNLNMVAIGNVHAGLKFLLGIVLGCVLIYFAVESFPLCWPWERAIVKDTIYILLIFSASMILCFVPIRMSSAKDTVYGKLFATERNNEIAIAKAELSANNANKEDTIKTINERAKVKEEILKTADKEYIETMAHEIAMARIHLATFALQKWEEKQHQQIERDVEKYINK